MGSHIHRILSFDEGSRTGVCSHCGPVRVKPKKRGSYWACLVAEARWEKRTAGRLLTNAQRHEMDAMHEGRCGICREERPLVVDNSHQTGVVRGLLCIPCNSALGRLEKPGWLAAAQDYLAPQKR